MKIRALPITSFWGKKSAGNAKIFFLHFAGTRSSRLDSERIDRDNRGKPVQIFFHLQGRIYETAARRLIQFSVLSAFCVCIAAPLGPKSSSKNLFFGCQIRNAAPKEFAAQALALGSLMVSTAVFTCYYLRSIVGNLIVLRVKGSKAAGRGAEDSVDGERETSCLKEESLC